MKGVQVLAETPRQAVVEAVESEIEETGTCCLLHLVRVSLRPRGGDHRDVYFEAPFEDQFPDLFLRYPDFLTATVEDY